MQALNLAELIASLSYALDITEGQPEGHCIRCCWIGMHIGRELGLSEDELWALYYTLLLKDLGCSSNAARICGLYLADDLSFKRDFKRVPVGLPSTFAFVVRQTGRHAGWSQRLSAITNIVRHAHATRATVSLDYGEDVLSVTIEDDGDGGPRLSNLVQGNGISGMQERARALAGELRVAAAPGGGLRVEADLPTGGPR